MSASTDIATAISSECFVARLRIVNRAVTKMYDDALRPLGVKISQLNILVVAARSETVTPAKVGRLLKLDASTLSRNVDRMESQGWIERLEDETDARAHILRVTAVGRRLVARAQPAWSGAQKEAEKLLGKSTFKAIAAAADTVRS